MFGLGYNSNPSESACSAYLTVTPDGKYLVGRNFDVPKTEAVSVYTHPNNGYAAIATCSTYLLGIGEEVDTTPTTSLLGRATLLAAPYYCLDGVNEKGLSVSSLDMSFEKIDQDNGNPDLTLTLAIRLLLDRASDVNEAVALLKQYDYHSEYGIVQHIFIADANGNAVVAEWHKDTLSIAESPICTNFRLSSNTSKESSTGNCVRLIVFIKL